MITRYFNLFSSMRVPPACRVTVEVSKRNDLYSLYPTTIYCNNICNEIN